MTTFKRHFDASVLNGHIGDQQSLIGTLLDRWVLPGQGKQSDTPLRLALRNGYLNLYANGQSVAKLSVQNSKPRLEVHWKYVEPASKRHSEDASPDGKTYRTFRGEQLLAPEAAAIVDEWIARAKTYAGDEKRFVEHLVAANPNVIDLEMALPGDDQLKSCMEKRQGKRVAPRMDLVVVHLLDDGQPVIDFWEAKLANNGELRATLPANGGTKEPHICSQLTDYERWMRLPHRTEEVRQAFHNAAGDLGALADLTGKHGAARELWRALAERPPEINPVPGIVIGNYDPGCPEATALPAAKSFERHLARLETDYSGAPRFTVREVESRACPKRMITAPLAGARL